MRISDWSSDVCSSDLGDRDGACVGGPRLLRGRKRRGQHFPDLRLVEGNGISRFYDEGGYGSIVEEQGQAVTGLALGTLLALDSDDVAARLLPAALDGHATPL